jgi:ABC-type glycerol-3-phosphate transport system substrate-binding protein
MKKLLFVLAIAATFAACNSGSETPAATDSTKVDTTAPAAADTTATADTTAVADTTKK